MLFYPMSEHVMTPDSMGIEYENVYFNSEDDVKITCALSTPTQRMICVDKDGERILGIVYECAFKIIAESIIR